MKTTCNAVLKRVSLLAIALAFALSLKGQTDEPAPDTKKAGEEVLALSKDKWRWMEERKMDVLADLFHEEAVFVHMGGSMTRKQELDTIESGRIHYKEAAIQDASVRVIGTTAIVLNRIRLLAVVGGREVTNPFVVTEVYVKPGDNWKLASLSFTRLGMPERPNEGRQ